MKNLPQTYTKLAFFLCFHYMVLGNFPLDNNAQDEANLENKSNSNCVPHDDTVLPKDINTLTFPGSFHRSRDRKQDKNELDKEKNGRGCGIKSIVYSRTGLTPTGLTPTGSSDFSTNCGCNNSSPAGLNHIGNVLYGTEEKDLIRNQY